MIAVMCTLQKNQAPVSRCPILYGAQRTSDRAAIVVHIVTSAPTVKPAFRRRPARAFCLDGFALALAAFERRPFS